jgi:glycosyltransferase involved in cell wall biosynthesis
MKVLHTEASTGWGGQEIRTFNEALALRNKGHEVFFVTQKGAKLADKAKKEGFRVLELNFFKKFWLFSLPKLVAFIKKNQINLVVTHSSLDAWLAGAAARIAKTGLIRIRHVSTPTRPGLNAKLLFDYFADFIITTSEEIVEPLAHASGKSKDFIKCIPTGVDPSRLQINDEQVEIFKSAFGLQKDDFILGSVCVVRSWKGIESLIGAADILRDEPNLKWLIVGGGYLEQHIQRVKDLKLEDKVIFTGHLENPTVALKTLDVFLLLSTANEGISQASLQASYLSKPLITTATGGLKEVCLDQKNGFIVPIRDPIAVASAVVKLKDENLRNDMGIFSKNHVLESFLFEKTLKEVETIYMRFSCSKY